MAGQHGGHFLVRGHNHPSLKTQGPQSAKNSRGQALTLFNKDTNMKLGLHLVRLMILCGAVALAAPVFPSPAGAAPEASGSAENAALPDKPIKISERHTPVAVEYKGDDSIGSRLSTRVKELLNSSNLFTLDAKDAPKFRILLSTAPEFKDRPGVGSAYSVVWVFSLSEATLRHYLDNEVGVLTPDDVDNLAARIVEQTDKMATRYGYLFPEQPQ